jgi:hypothetical protein
MYWFINQSNGAPSSHTKSDKAGVDMESFDVSEESVSESDEIEEFRSRSEDARPTVYDGCTVTLERNAGCQRRVCGVGDVDPG